MGIDTRVGKRDYHTRYRVYKPNIDIHDKIVFDNECEGILHAKDITPYSTTPDMFGNRFQRDVTRATIETMDKTDIKPDWFLYAMSEECWYTVESVSANSHNESQRFSSRPINTTQIVIRKTT